MICSVMQHLLNRKVSEKHLLITVNCFSLKRLDLMKEITVCYISDVIM